jgi:hypothetical protein
MSNKKARNDHCSESDTPLSCSTSTLASTSTSSAQDGVGRIIPQWSFPTALSVAEKYPYRGIGDASGGQGVNF